MRILFEDVFDTAFEGVVDRKVELRSRRRWRFLSMRWSALANTGKVELYLIRLEPPRRYPASPLLPSSFKRKWVWLAVYGRGGDLDRYFFETVPGILRRGDLSNDTKESLEKAETGVEIFRVKRRHIEKHTEFHASDFESYLFGSLKLLQEQS